MRRGFDARARDYAKHEKSQDGVSRLARINLQIEPEAAVFGFLTGITGLIAGYSVIATLPPSHVLLI
jgi:hypothetical protein